MTLTAEQLEARKSRVGASDVAAIMGLGGFKGRNALSVWLDKTDQLEPEKSVPDHMEAGNILEPALLNYAEQEYGAMERNVVVFDPGQTPIASTLDGRIIANGQPVEAKTSGIFGPIHGEWGDPMTDAVPLNYIVQCQTQLLCTGADVCRLIALLGGRGVIEYRIQPADDIMALIRNVASDFFEGYVRTRRNPREGWSERLEKVHGVKVTSDPCEPILETVKRWRRTPGKVLVAADKPEAFDLISAWNQAREARLAAEKSESAAKAGLLAAMEDAEAIDFNDPKKWVTNFTQSRTVFDVQALAEEHPDLYAKYERTSTFPVLRIANKPR